MATWDIDGAAMHHLELEDRELRMDKLSEAVRKHAAEVMAEKANKAMEPLRRREPIADDYNEPTHRQNIRVKNDQFTDLTAEMVNHPAHYTKGDIECIDVLEQLAADGHDFRILNAIKYLWRYRHKGGDESLRKAVWYINRVIDNG